MSFPTDHTFNTYLINNDAPTAVTWERLHQSTFDGRSSMDTNGSHSSLDGIKSGRKRYQGSDHYAYNGRISPCWKQREYEFNSLGLHDEILDFFNYISPKPSEELMRNEVVQRVRGVIQNKWPEAKVEVFGSFNTGLYLPTSDIDIVVFGNWPVLPLFFVEHELKNAEIAVPGSLMVLDKTTVPIVKFTDKWTEVKVDISFNMQSGLLSAKKIKTFLKQYPILDKLVMIIKQFLYQRNLNEVYTGGIGSYSLILMIISFLQHNPRVGPDSEDSILGILLTEFFELYGRNFNYAKVGIKVDGTGSYFNKMEHGINESTLCIIDPADPTNNVGRVCFGLWNVKCAFEHAFVTLSRALFTTNEGQHPTNKTILSLIVSVADEVVEHRKWVQQQWGHVISPHQNNHLSSSLAANSVTRNRCGSALSDKKSNQRQDYAKTTRISS